MIDFKKMAPCTSPQHQLQQHQQASSNQQPHPSAMAAQPMDMHTVNKIMNFLTGPHASVIQQLQQQQQQHPSCGDGGACGIDPAGQEHLALTHEQQQQITGTEIDDQGMVVGMGRAEAQGESDNDEGTMEDEDDDEEEDEDEEEDVAKGTTDVDSQTQNVSSSSESDEQLNPQWDEKMWRKVAHRPNHPFQKKAQQVTQQKALGEEESIDNDTIAGEWEAENFGVGFGYMM